MLTKRTLLVCLELLVVVGIVSCTPTIVSTDAGVYQNGKMYAVSSKDIDAVYQATLVAMDKLQLKVEEKMKDVFAAKVIASSADGKRVVVTIKPGAEKKTEFNISVGYGDEERVRKVYAEIDSALMAKGK
jgi:hypothetical protein